MSGIMKLGELIDEAEVYIRELEAKNYKLKNQVEELENRLKSITRISLKND